MIASAAGYYPTSAVCQKSVTSTAANPGVALGLMDTDKNFFHHFPGACLPLPAVPPAVHPNVAGAVEEQRMDFTRYTQMVANRNLLSASQFQNYFCTRPGPYAPRPSGSVVTQPHTNSFWWNYGTQDSGEQQVLNCGTTAVALNSGALNPWDISAYPSPRYTAPSPATISCTPVSNVATAGNALQRNYQLLASANPDSLRKTSARKKTGNRKTYSYEQKALLEREYARNNYITSRTRAELAELTGLTERQVKNWFQNKRTKTKRIRGSLDFVPTPTENRCIPYPPPQFTNLSPGISGQGGILVMPADSTLASAAQSPLHILTTVASSGCL